MAPPASDGAGGVIYTLTFDRYEDANQAWRYSDLTRQVTFTSSALEETIERECGEFEFIA